MANKVRSHKMMTRWKWMIWKISGDRLENFRPKSLQIQSEIKWSLMPWNMIFLTLITIHSFINAFKFPMLK